MIFSENSPEYDVDEIDMELERHLQDINGEKENDFEESNIMDLYAKCDIEYTDLDPFPTSQHVSSNDLRKFLKWKDDPEINPEVEKKVYKRFIKTAIRGVSGLYNLGNTCYINASLQALASLNIVNDYFLNDDFKEELANYSKKNKIKINRTMSYELSEILLSMRNNDDAVINNDESIIDPKSFIMRFIKKHEMFSYIGEQHDCTEFLNTLLDDIHEELKYEIELNPIYEIEELKYNELKKIYKTLPNEEKYQIKDANLDIVLKHKFIKYLKSQKFDTTMSVIHNCFNYYILTINTCLNCNNETRIFGSLYCMMLNINEKSMCDNDNNEYSISSLLEQEFITENVDNKKKCSKCNIECEYSRNLYMWSRPKILMVSIKKWDQQNTKINKKVKLEEQIYIKKDYNYNSRNGYNKDTVYNLTAVIQHAGSSADSGHYVAYVKNYYDHKWYLCNDEDIKMVSYEYVLNVDAYVAIYSRC